MRALPVPERFLPVPERFLGGQKAYDREQETEPGAMSGAPNRSLMSRLAALLAVIVVLMASQAGAQTYPVTTGDLSVGDSSPEASNLTAGSQISVSGNGFSPGVTITITIESDPVTLGTTQSDENGAFTFTGTIPADFTNGAHTVKASGQNNDGTLVLNRGVTVSGGAPAELAFTGSNSMIALILAVSLAGAGALLVAISRRSRLA